VKGYPFDVILTDGLLVSGAILADQVKSLDWQARQIKKIGALPHKKNARTPAKNRGADFMNSKLLRIQF
jgi:mRNA interferase MazF